MGSGVRRERQRPEVEGQDMSLCSLIQFDLSHRVATGEGLTDQDKDTPCMEVEVAAIDEEVGELPPQREVVQESQVGLLDQANVPLAE